MFLAVEENKEMAVSFQKKISELCEKTKLLNSKLNETKLGCSKG